MTEQKREDQVNELEAQIDRWSQDLVQLKDRARNAGTEAQSRFDSRLQELEPQLDEARARIQRLRTEAGGAVDELRTGAREAVERLGVSVERARQEFR